MATLATLAVLTDNPMFEGRSRVILDWLSTDLGVVSKTIAAGFAGQAQQTGGIKYIPEKVKGKLVSVETIPGLLGDLTTTLPTALYDITLLDAYSYDVADGNLANRSGTVAETVVFDSPVPIDSELTLTIAAAGDAKTGRVILTFID